MAGQQQIMQGQDSYDQQILEGIKREVCLSNHQLLQLSHNDEKFYLKLYELNKQGYKLITQQRYHQASIYLSQAQKVLQYAASCGKTIQRNFIITTLHNEASLYQRAWQLQKAASYIEAIIFNISLVEKDQGFQFTQEIFDQTSNTYEDFRSYLWRKKGLALYYLQFCAVNSQNKNHLNAYSSAMKSIVLLRSICMDYYRYEDILNPQQNNQQNTNILYQLGTLNFQKVKQTEFYSCLKKATIQVASYLKRLQQRQIPQNSQFNEKFSTYSIGHLMQINPYQLKVHADKLDIKNQLTIQEKIFKAIYISIGHFILATQLRFISSEKYTLDQNQRKNSIEYRESQVYHLWAVIIAAKYLPCKSLYFDHIINSFKNHYKFNILDDAQKYLQNDNQQIFQYQVQAKIQDDHEGFIEKQYQEQNVKQSENLVQSQTFQIDIQNSQQIIQQKNVVPLSNRQYPLNNIKPKLHKNSMHQTSKKQIKQKTHSSTKKLVPKKSLPKLQCQNQQTPKLSKPLTTQSNSFKSPLKQNMINRLKSAHKSIHKHKKSITKLQMLKPESSQYMKKSRSKSRNKGFTQRNESLYQTKTKVKEAKVKLDEHKVKKDTKIKNKKCSKQKILKVISPELKTKKFKSPKTLRKTIYP